ncbi:MAG: hypothetical protein QOC99_2708 [Acidobacteriota bacterium]|nr:hypothetical protein [Acidobacteriota bacterium]MDT7780196.1 hypothetical protein [Acidobacteriota bacterium]
MRKLPVYLLLDTSGSMMGEPIEAVKNGMQILVSALRQDPYALETAHLSVITFDTNVRQVVPLSELTSFNMPDIQATGVTSLGAALKLLAERSDAEVTKTTAEVKGDWKPMVFIMTDGGPTDDWQAGLAEFRKRKFGIVVACAAGPGADTACLKQITDNVVTLDTADTSSLRAFFKWVSSSISTGSQKVDANGKEVGGISELPPPPAELSVVV